MAHGVWMLSLLRRCLLIFYRLCCCFDNCINSCIERDAWKDLCCFQDITDQFGLVYQVMENKVVVLVLDVDRRGRVYKGMQSNWLTAFGCWAFWVGDCLYFIVCFCCFNSCINSRIGRDILKKAAVYFASQSKWGTPLFRTISKYGRSVVYVQLWMFITVIITHG